MLDPTEFAWVLVLVGLVGFPVVFTSEPAHDEANPIGTEYRSVRDSKPRAGWYLELGGTLTDPM